jgi:outer membrane protein W
MNHLNLTQRTIKIVRWRSKLQFLLPVILIHFLAVPGLAQVTSSVKEQSESASASDDSQAQVQRKTLPTLNLETLRFEEQAKEQDRLRSNPKSATNYLFTKAGLNETAGASSPQPGSDLSNFAVWVNAGAAVPHGDLSTFLDPGFSLNGGLEYMITPQFSAEGTFGYHRFSTFFGDDASLYQLSGNGKFYFVDQSSSVRPFVNGGVGAYVTDSATTHFGGNVGFGVLFEVTPQFGLQGAYNFHVFSFGDNAKFSTVQGGVRFRF